MGQYYKPYIKTKDAEYTLSSWTHDNGAKLMEHSWLGNDFVSCVYEIIRENPALVGWIGDYSDDAGANHEIYEKLWGENAMPEHQMESPKLFWTDDDKVEAFGYLINHTKKQFIDLKDYQKLATVDDWCVNPLPLLTAIGNGLGGGDYHKNNENYNMVGYWYMNEIEFSDSAPEGYADFTEEFIFREV